MTHVRISFKKSEKHKTKHSSGHDDVGGGQQYGEAGDDGEQRVHNQTQPVNHHRGELPVSLHRCGLVLLLHLQRSVIMGANWSHRMVSYFHGKLQGHSKYIQFMFKISSILYFDASKFTSICIDSLSLLSNFSQSQIEFPFTFSVIILISFKIRRSSFWSGPTDFASSKTAGLYGALEKILLNKNQKLFMKPDIIVSIIHLNDIYI